MENFLWYTGAANIISLKIIAVEEINGNKLISNWTRKNQLITTDKGQFIDNAVGTLDGRFETETPGYDWKNYIDKEIFDFRIEKSKGIPWLKKDLSNEKIVFVCINKSYERLSRGIIIKGRENLYQCTRKYWPIDIVKANNSEYVAGVYKGIVKTLFKKTDIWKPVRSFKDFLDDDEIKENPTLLNRYAFTGIEAEQNVARKYIDKKMPNSLRFYGNIVTYNF